MEATKAFLAFGYKKEELKKLTPLHMKRQKAFPYLTGSVMSQLSKSNFPPTTTERDSHIALVGVSGQLELNPTQEKRMFYNPNQTTLCL